MYLWLAILVGRLDWIRKVRIQGGGGETWTHTKKNIIAFFLLAGDSGEFTYVTTWQEHSIAYHVSTLLPSSQGDKQQIQRKRHIGNGKWEKNRFIFFVVVIYSHAWIVDIVCLVFVEGKQPFNPAAIKSQFLHVFIVVHKEGSEDLARWR